MSKGGLILAGVLGATIIGGGAYYFTQDGVDNPLDSLTSAAPENPNADKIIKIDPKSVDLKEMQAFIETMDLSVLLDKWKQEDPNAFSHYDKEEMDTHVGYIVHNVNTQWDYAGLFRSVMNMDPTMAQALSQDPEYMSFVEGSMKQRMKTKEMHIAHNKEFTNMTVSFPDAIYVEDGEEGNIYKTRLESTKQEFGFSGIPVQQLALTAASIKDAKEGGDMERLGELMESLKYLLANRTMQVRYDSENAKYIDEEQGKEIQLAPVAKFSMSGVMRPDALSGIFNIDLNVDDAQYTAAYKPFLDAHPYYKRMMSTNYVNQSMAHLRGKMDMVANIAVDVFFPEGGKMDSKYVSLDVKEIKYSDDWYKSRATAQVVVDKRTPDALSTVSFDAMARYTENWYANNSISKWVKALKEYLAAQEPTQQQPFSPMAMFGGFLDKAEFMGTRLDPLLPKLHTMGDITMKGNFNFSAQRGASVPFMGELSLGSDDYGMGTKIESSGMGPAGPNGKAIMKFRNVDGLINDMVDYYSTNFDVLNELAPEAFYMAPSLGLSDGMIDFMRQISDEPGTTDENITITVSSDDPSKFMGAAMLSQQLILPYLIDQRGNER